MQIRRQPSAFTLVELMIVVVIIGIITSIMVAEMGGSLEDALLRGNARKIIDVCDSASNRAIAIGQAQILRVDPKTGRFSVQSKPQNLDEEPLPPTASGELDTRISLSIREPQRDPEAEEPAAPASDAIAFNADGTADAREFLLRDRAGVELLLRINPATSRVRIVDMTPQ